MPKPAEQTVIKLAFESASIFDGYVRPRVELPAPAFLCEGNQRPFSGTHTLEVIEGNAETVRERFLGVANPQHLVLVLAPRDFDHLKDRVRSICDKPLRFEVVVDQYDQVVAVTIDGKAVHLPPHRSGVMGGEIDYEIDEQAG